MFHYAIGMYMHNNEFLREGNLFVIVETNNKYLL